MFVIKILDMMSGDEKRDIVYPELRQEMDALRLSSAAKSDGSSSLALIALCLLIFNIAWILLLIAWYRHQKNRRPRTILLSTNDGTSSLRTEKRSGGSISSVPSS